jgi:HEAT repeat protein
MGGADVAAHIKRCLSMYRLYGFEHALSKGAEVAFSEKLTETLAKEPQLTLTFDSQGLKHANKRVLEEEKKEESITRALFSDGVEAMTFTQGCPSDQLLALLHTWHEALTTATDSEHTFTTRLWERGLTSIEVIIRPGLAEHGVQESEAAAHKNRVTKMISELSNDRELPPNARMKIVDAGALSVLREVEAFRKLDRAELERRANAERAPVVELSHADNTALVSGITGTDRGVGQRTIFALWRAFPVASPLERAELGEFVRKIVATLVLEKRTQEVCRALARIAENDASPKQKRDVADFLECLKSEALVSALVKLLEDAESQADALALLSLLPAEHIGLLVPALVSASHDVRAKIAALIVSKTPEPESLAGWVIEYGEPVTATVLAIAEKIGPDHADLTIRACLVHESEEVRYKGAMSVRTERVPAFRTLLLTLLGDQNQNIRHAVLQALIRARDPIASEMLAKQLHDVTCAPEIAKTCIRGLASLGGPRAGEVLRRVFNESNDKELRKAAALGLANIPDAATIALLEEESHKLLGDRAIKDACKEALRRIKNR